MKPFNKGDRFRLIHLDGTISEGTFEVHDRWGDERTPRNASFISGSQEELVHTDMMRHVDDASPVVVPDGGEWYIAIGDAFGWGRAQAEKQAVANMRRASSSGRPIGYIVYRVSKWTTVNGMGSLSWPRGIEPVEVKRVGIPKKKRA